MNSKFNLTFSQFKTKARFKGADATVHGYRTLGLITYQQKNSRCLYSEESVTQLQLISELKKYSYKIKEIKNIFEKVPFDVLEKKVGDVSPNDLSKLIVSYENKQMLIPFK